MKKGREKYAGMDDCHARDQRFAGDTRHGKNYFGRKYAGYAGNFTIV